MYTLEGAGACSPGKFCNLRPQMTYSRFVCFWDPVRGGGTPAAPPSGFAMMASSLMLRCPLYNQMTRCVKYKNTHTREINNIIYNIYLD